MPPLSGFPGHGEFEDHKSLWRAMRDIARDFAFRGYPRGVIGFLKLCRRTKLLPACEMQSFALRNAAKRGQSAHCGTKREDGAVTETAAHQRGEAIKRRDITFAGRLMSGKLPRTASNSCKREGSNSIPTN